MESGDLTELLDSEVLSLARDLDEALAQDFQEVSPAAGPVRAHRAAGGPGPGHHHQSRRRSTPPRPTTPTGPGYLSNLGTALRARFERTGQQADLDQALEAFREGAGVLTASPA